jgi:transposase, IS5 family
VALVDVLYAQCTKVKAKPRTYRKIARKKWLIFSKRRRHTHAQIRKMNRSLRGYLGRNFKHLDKLIDPVDLQTHRKAQYKNLLVIREVYRQQKEMFELQTQCVDSRM